MVVTAVSVVILGITPHDVGLGAFEWIVIAEIFAVTLDFGWIYLRIDLLRYASRNKNNNG